MLDFSQPRNLELFNQPPFPALHVRNRPFTHTDAIHALCPLFRDILEEFDGDVNQSRADEFGDGFTERVDAEVGGEAL